MMKRRQMRAHFTFQSFVDPCWRKPALRPNRAEMSPAAFVGLVAGWSGCVSGMLFISLLVRLLGWN
jgi:hypothetical protein